MNIKVKLTKTDGTEEISDAISLLENKVILVPIPEFHKRGLEVYRIECSDDILKSVKLAPLLKKAGFCKEIYMSNVNGMLFVEKKSKKKVKK